MWHTEGPVREFPFSVVEFFRGRSDSFTALTVRLIARMVMATSATDSKIPVHPDTRFVWIMMTFSLQLAVA